MTGNCHVIMAVLLALVTAGCGENETKGTVEAGFTPNLERNDGLHKPAADAERQGD